MDTKTYEIKLKAKTLERANKSNISIAITPPSHEKILFAKPLKQDMREAIVITGEKKKTRLLDILGYNNAPNITVAPRTILAKGTTNVGAVFQFCQNITELDLTEWDISSVNKMTNLCESCDKLEYIDISNWNTSKVRQFAYMFIDCTALRKIDGVIDLASCDSQQGFVSMFSNCPNLSGVKLKNLPAGFNGAGLQPNQYEIVE